MTKYYIQIGVPHAVYGDHTYFMADKLQNWLRDRGLNGTYCGKEYTGSGQNGHSIYIVKGASETDDLAFKMMFPDCKIHTSRQLVYD